MNTKIKALFKSYQQAFDQFDPNAIASHYKLPCIISDVDGQQCYTNLDTLTDKFFDNCKKMQGIGYSGSEFSIGDINTLGKESISVDIGWRVQLTAGPFDFRTLYLCNRKDDNWLIFSAVVYDGNFTY